MLKDELYLMIRLPLNVSVLQHYTLQQYSVIVDASPLSFDRVISLVISLVSQSDGHDASFSAVCFSGQLLLSLSVPSIKPYICMYVWMYIYHYEI